MSEGDRITKKVGILLISFFFEPSIGGVESHLNDLCNFLTTSGFSVFIITFQPLSSQLLGRELEVDGSKRIYRIPSPIGGNFYKLGAHPIIRQTILIPLIFLLSFSVLLKYRKKIQVIHAHELNSGFSAALLRLLFRKRTVITIHSNPDYLNEVSNSFINKSYRLMLLQFDSLIAISRSVAHKLETVIGPFERILTMTYWVDLGLFAPGDKLGLKTAHGLNDKFNVLFVGRLVEAKGVLLLMELCERLKTQLDITFLVVGEGPLEQLINDRSDSLPNIKYLGSKSQKEMPTYYNLADVCIVPSLYEEGFGRVIMESISCGTPVIASKRGGIPEAVDDSVAIIVEPSTDNFLLKIEELYRNRSLLSELAHNCRSYAERKYALANAKLLMQAYNLD